MAAHGEGGWGVTDTEIILALACVFLLCMLALSLIDRRTRYHDGERVGYLRACDRMAQRMKGSGMLDELRQWKNERTNHESE